MNSLLLAEIDESWAAGNRAETLRIVSDSIESLKTEPSGYCDVFNGLARFGALVRERIGADEEQQRNWRQRICTIRSLLVRAFCHAALVFLFEPKYVFKLHRAIGSRVLAMFHQMFTLQQLRHIDPDQVRQFATNVYADHVATFDALVAIPTRYMFALIQKVQIERLVTFQHFHGAIDYLDKNDAATILARLEQLGLVVPDERAAADIALGLIEHDCVDNNDFVTFVNDHCGLLKRDIGVKLLPRMINRGNKTLSVKSLEWSLHGPKGQVDQELFRAVAGLFDDGDIDALIRLRALAPIDDQVHRILCAKVPSTSNFALISVPFLQPSSN